VRRVLSAPMLVVLVSSVFVQPARPALAAPTVSVASDFDGDGFADVAVGVPFEGPGRRAPSTGGVSVLYGGPDGVSSVENQLWLPSSPGLDWGHDSFTESLFGIETAAGDFDGDGLADLAIGSPGWEQVNVLYGSVDGLTTQRDQRWTSETSGLVPGVPPIHQFGQFGGVLETGDFDGDGFADLALGIRDDPDQSFSVGHVRVLYGSAAGLTVEGNQDWSEGTPGVLGRAEGYGDLFGFELAAGDLGRGPEDDIAIGEPFDDGGFVHVLYGSPGTGLTAEDDQMWSQGTTGVPGDRTDGDWFGFALAAGDFGGRYDVDDLAVGAPGSADRSGKVVVLYARRDGLVARGSQEWTQDSWGVEDETEPGDGFGRALAGGSFDMTGHEDLAIGVPGEDSATMTNTGAVAVLGSSFGCAEVGALCADEDQLWTLDASGVAGRAGSQDLFGTALAARGGGATLAGDDLVIGIPGKDVARFISAGAAAVIYVDDGGLAPAGSQLWTLDSPGVIGRPGRLERFGSTVG
jgi:FG-GAP repeat protein